MKFDNLLAFIFGKGGLVLLLVVIMCSLVFMTACSACITMEDVKYVCVGDNCVETMFALWKCDTYAKMLGCTCNKIEACITCGASGGENRDTCVGNTYNCIFGKVWDCASCEGCEDENVCKYCKEEYYAPIMYNGRECCPNCKKPIK